MVRIETRSSLEKFLERSSSRQVTVGIFSPFKDVIPELSELADSLQHVLTNMTKSRDSVEVVIIDHEVSEAHIWHGRRLMHVIVDPSQRSVTEAYRIVRGHYSDF